MDGQSNPDNTKSDNLGGKQPSLKQERALAVLVESGGRLSKGEVLRRAGFSESTANQPNKVFGSATWEKLMKRHLPDTFLAHKHRQLMSQQKLKKEYVPVETDDEQIIEMCGRLGVDLLRIGLTKDKKAKVLWLAVPDVDALRHGLNMAYDLKGKYAPKKVESTLTSLEMLLIGLRDDRDNNGGALPGGKTGTSLADGGLHTLREQGPLDQDERGRANQVQTQPAPANGGGDQAEATKGDREG